MIACGLLQVTPAGDGIFRKVCIRHRQWLRYKYADFALPFILFEKGQRIFIVFAPFHCTPNVSLVVHPRPGTDFNSLGHSIDSLSAA